MEISELKKIKWHKQLVTNENLIKIYRVLEINNIALESLSKETIENVRYMEMFFGVNRNENRNMEMFYGVNMNQNRNMEMFYGVNMNQYRNMEMFYGVNMNQNRNMEMFYGVNRNENHFHVNELGEIPGNQQAYYFLTDSAVLINFE
ncbi:unnamed protein product [Brachionus calyciflorus]|uniref:Uncharacterized protein n=1 Tax=Brachionus calyciflorus TaxID=104777 RepID=A0A814FWB3_9BILA|nr:unnamed protein product [Brachionus calyciflorus]